MDEGEINKIKQLIKKFNEDREMTGYAPDSIRSDNGGLWYLLEYLKTRDEQNITDITRDTLHSFQVDLYNKRGRRRIRLCLSTQLHILVSIRKFFQWLVKRGRLLADPSLWIKLPKQKKPLPRGVMTRREINRLLEKPDLDTPRGLRDRAMLELMYSSGLRSSEIRSLTPYDVNIAEGEATVRCGKGGKDRVVPVGELAGKFISLYIENARPHLLGERKDPGVLFIGRYAHRLNPNTLNFGIVQRYSQMAKIKKHITPHGFRHTCATHLLRGRANLRHIQNLLGHKSLESTQVYTRVEVGDLKRELKRCHPREQPR